MNAPSPGWHLVAKGCPFCGDDLSRMEKENCPTCGSPARARSLDPVLSETIQPLLAHAPLSKPLLGFAVTSAERKLLDKHFPQFKSVSLFGNYGSNHETGVDARDLSRYPDNSFSGVFGILIFDYFAEHANALRECYRTLAPGGIFFSLIAPYRLLDGSQPPHVDRMIKSRPGYFDYVPDNEPLASVKVGRDWFVEAMQETGFDARRITVQDAASGIVSDWFVGVKPDGAVTAHKAPRPVQNVAPPFATVYRCPACDNSFEGHATIENCPVCGAPPRARTVSSVLNGFVKKTVPDDLRESLPLLAVSMTPPERKQIDKLFRHIRSVSLYGSYGGGAHEEGVDVRDLNGVADGSCSAHFGIGVFDYFPEHEQALSEAFRILAPGGVLFTHILPYRLSDGDAPPEVTRQIKPRPGYFDYLPDDAKLLSIKVGREWFLKAMERAGFDAQYLVVHDAASNQDIGWFVGRKPADGKAAPAKQSQPQTSVPPPPRIAAPPPAASTQPTAKPVPASRPAPLALRRQRPWYKKALTALGLRNKRDQAEALRNAHLARASIAARSVPPARSRTSRPDTKEYVTPLPKEFGCERVTLTLSVPQLPRNGDFAEHVFDSAAYVPTDEIVAVASDGVVVSRDLGKTWKYIPLPAAKGIRLKNCFTLSDGSHLLQGNTGTTTPAERAANPDLAAPLLHFDPSWDFLGRHQPGKCHWHGSRSIDQFGDTVIYAEYTDNRVAYRNTPKASREEMAVTSETQHVFKSADGGKSWRKVFEASWEDIRHFHTVAADPFQPKTWWLSSGDSPAECRVWRSVDDGETWTEVQGEPQGGLHDDRFRQSVFRYTDIQILPNRMIWGSDDLLGAHGLVMSGRSGSQVFVSSKEVPLRPASIGRIGNPVRSIVDAGRAYVLITEAKARHAIRRPQIFLMLKEEPHTLVEIATADTFGTGTGFTYSIASRAAKNGRFFTYRNSTDVFPNGPRILQWDISFD